MAENIQSTNVSLTFKTAAAAGSILKAEVDEADNGGESGEFAFGSDVYYRLYKYNVKSYIVDLSDANASDSSAGSGTKTNIEEYITFANEKEARTSYPINPGTLKFTPLGGIAMNKVNEEADTIILDKKVVGVAKVSYNSSYDLRYISNVKEPSNYIVGEGYPVIVFIRQTS